MCIHRIKKKYPRGHTKRHINKEKATGQGDLLFQKDAQQSQPGEPALGWGVEHLVCTLLQGSDCISPRCWGPNFRI